MARKFPVVLRVAPLKEGHLKGAHVHQTRQHRGPMPNVDAARTHLNRTLAGTGDVLADVQAVLATAPNAHPRGAVCCEMILSADDEYFDAICPAWRTGATSPKLEAWVARNTAWLRQTYPGLASATLHLDEGSPHIHVMVVPISEYEQGYRRGSKTVRKVNYNRIFGDDAKVIFEARRTGNSELTKLGRLQTTYACAMSSCGLARGVKNSRASHRSVKEHQTLVNAPVNTPRIPAVPVIERTVSDAIKSKVGITSEADRAVIQAESELKRYRSDLNKYQKQLAAKGKEFDKMKDEHTDMRAALIDKDASISRLTSELALTKEAIGKLRNYPLHDVRNALNYDGPMSSDDGKPLWRNAIDMVKSVAGFDYGEAVNWLNHQFGSHITKEIVASSAVQAASDIVERMAARNDKPKYTKQEYAIVQELDKQLKALDAKSYRITMFHQSDKPTYNVGKGKAADGSERLYSVSEVLQQVPRLNNENWRRGYNVFITPVDPERHYLLIDDLTDKTLGLLKSAGFTPNLVQRSSTSSIQAVMVLPKSEIDSDVGNAFFKDLNTQYGDANIRGFIHPFRAVGFRNVKAKHLDSDSGRFPVVSLMERVAGVCQRALAACKAIAQATALLAPGAAPAASQRRLRAVLALPHVTAGDALSQEAQQFYRWCEHRYGSPDWSRADWMLMTRLVDRGVPNEQIAAVLRENSPGLSERHRGVDRYLATTLAARDQVGDSEPVGATPK